MFLSTHFEVFIFYFMYTVIFYYNQLRSRGFRFKKLQSHLYCYVFNEDFYNFFFHIYIFKIHNDIVGIFFSWCLILHFFFVPKGYSILKLCFFFFSNVDEKFLIMSLFEVYILVLINNLRTKKLYYTIVLKLIKAIIRRQYSILFLSLNFHSSAGLLKRTISFKLHFFKNNDTILFFFF